MKINKLLLGFLLTMTAGICFPQHVMTFCPGPGLNDGSDEGGLNGGKDAYVYDELNTTNFGAQVYIATNPVSTCNLTNLQAYIKFDVSSLPSEVDSVFLWFYNWPYNVNCYSNCDNTFDLRFVTSEWNEMTLNWDNRPASGDPFSDTVRITFPYDGGPIRLDITHAYVAWRISNMVNHGLTIYPLDGSCNNACVGFAPYSSDEGDISKRPCLEIYYKTSGFEEPGINVVQVNAYPNPVKDNLTLNISLARPEVITLSILDFSGRIVYSRILNYSVTGNNFLKINTSDYCSGLYFYHLTTPRGVASGKFEVLKD